MNEPNFSTVAISIYSKIIEESMLTYLNSEEAVEASKLTFSQRIELRSGIQSAAADAAKDLVGKLQAAGAFKQGIAKDEEKKIVKAVISEHIAKWSKSAK